MDAEISDPHHARPTRSGTLWYEGLLVLLILAGLVSVLWNLYKWGYLPQPFIFDTNGTFADWINVAYWAHHPGAFDVWRTVYPPLTYAFLKIFSLGSCYETDSFSYNVGCDWLSVVSIIGFYALNAVLVFLAYRKVDSRTAKLRTIALMLGFPMLYALERGNMIIPAFTFFVLGYSRVLKSAWMRWLAVAMTINFKPYLVFSAMPYAARRRWRWLEGCALATTLVYLVTFAIVGSGSPLEIVQNQRDWLVFVGPQYYWNIYYSTSYAPFLEAIRSGPYPLLLWMPSHLLEVLTLVVPILIRIGQVGVIATMAVAWFRPTAAPVYRLSALALSLVLTASNPGGYTEVFLVFLVFLEPWRGPALITALVAAYLISIPADHMLIGVKGYTQVSWLTQRDVATTFGLSVGQFVRPALLLVIQYALVIATLVEAIRAPRRMAAGEDLILDAPPIPAVVGL